MEIKRGKHLAFKIPNGKRLVRCNSLGADYSETAIMERISGKRIVAPGTKAAVNSKPNLRIDIQAKMAEGKGKGYERWAKTLICLQENELTDLGELEKACQAAKRYFDSLGLKKLPSIQSLKQEYAMLKVENKKRYPEYKRAREKMIELLTANNGPP